MGTKNLASVARSSFVKLAYQWPAMFPHVRASQLMDRSTLTRQLATGLHKALAQGPMTIQHYVDSQVSRFHLSCCSLGCYKCSKNSGTD